MELALLLDSAVLKSFESLALQVDEFGVTPSVYCRAVTLIPASSP